MPPRRLLLLLAAVAAASSLLAAAASPAVVHAALLTSDGELPAGDPAAAAPRTVDGDDTAALRGACGGHVILPPDMIRATAVPAAGQPGVYDVTVVFRATRSVGGQYHVVPSSVGDGDGHRQEGSLVVPILIMGLLAIFLPLIIVFCLDVILRLRGDGDDEAYAGGDAAAVPMKRVVVDLVHADAAKQPRGDN